MQYSLVSTLEAFWEQNILEYFPQLAEEFPGDITLAQTIAVWKYIVEYQERQKHDY